MNKAVREYMAEIGARGGATKTEATKRRGGWGSMTPEERSARASAAAKARYDKAKARAPKVSKS